VDICPVEPTLEGGGIVVLVGGFPGGGNMVWNIAITSLHWLLRRSIKSTQTLHRYFIMPYQILFSLITLYTHLNMDTHFWTHCSHSNIG